MSYHGVASDIRKPLNLDKWVTFYFFSKIVCTVEKVLSLSLGFFHFYGKIFYQRMLEKELEMLDLRPHAKILHIGTGSLPYTAFYLAKKGFDIQGIDLDPTAVRRSNILLKHLKMSRTIQIIERSGLSIDPSSFDAVWISLHVSNKDLIIKSLLIKTGNGLSIICREPRSWLSFFYLKTKKDVCFKGLEYNKCINRLGKKSIAIIKKKESV